MPCWKFIFQQDGAPAHGAMQTQQWVGEHCPEFIDKDSWLPNRPHLNLLDYCMCGALLEEFNKFILKPPNTSDSFAESGLMKQSAKLS